MNCISRITEKLQSLQDIENDLQLDGNGQLFLCLQDLCMKDYLEELDKEVKHEDSKTRALVIITDEEWDIHNLQSAFEDEAERTYWGKDIITNRDNVMKFVHKVFKLNIYSFILYFKKFFNDNSTADK